MTLNVKDTENTAAPASPAAPSAAAPKSPAEAPARPQPVALEVPVTVNGARTVEGSDKREPFSEKSATVLVFGHGAVIRISALLAPGQLVFLTNEKSKKEVVCQVVKSKMDGNAVGYVELRFTEPAPGFWGMRFPSDTVLPQPAARPAAPAPVPAAPKAAPPAPPVAAQPVAPAPPAPPKPVIAVSPAPVAAPPELPTISAPAAETAPAFVEPKVPFPTPVPPAPIAPPQVASHAEPVPPPPAIVEAPAAPVSAAPVNPIAESKAIAPVISAPSSSVPSTEELKQQAARLQEQLSSLLFTEAPKPAAPVAAPSASVSEKENAAAPDLAQKVLELANPSPEPGALKPIKVGAPPRPTPSSLEVEEIKIPSWLAPLARESEAPAPSANTFHVEGTNSDVESVIPPAPEAEVLSEAQESTRRPETAVFGGQLLGEATHPSDGPGGKSKTGLFLGIAAALLLVAGGVWYSRQPGNALSGMLSNNSAPAPHPVVEPEAAAPAAHAPAPVAAASAPSSLPAPVTPPAEPAASAPVERNSRNATSSSTVAQRNPQPVVEAPKKPALGDVHLAKPTISRGSSPASSADPALEISSNASASTPVSALGGSNHAGPVAPVPVGGDVKPAQLIESVPPQYPQMARNQHLGGNVIIDALVDAEGNVSSMKVLSGPPLLHQAALNALKQWKYEPAELNGKPTSMHLTVTIQFRAQ